MGLLSSSLTFRRYRVVSEVPGSLRGQLEELIASHAFRENDKARTKEDNVGWVSIEDPGEQKLSSHLFLFTNYVVLSMRVDRKRVPGRFLRIQVDRKIRETMQAKGVERLGVAHKREIKETMEEDLLGRALPTVGTYDVIWDMQRGEVLFFATSDAIQDLFRALFKDTFQLELTAVRLSDWLLPLFSRDDLEAIASNLAATNWRA